MVVTVPLLCSRCQKTKCVFDGKSLHPILLLPCKVENSHFHSMPMPSQSGKYSGRKSHVSQDYAAGVKNGKQSFSFNAHVITKWEIFCQKVSCFPRL